MIFFMLLFSACGGQEHDALNEINDDTVYFIPPTLSEKAAPIQLDTPTAPPPSPTPACENNLAFVDDISVPDGTEFAPGEKIEKIWKVGNTGSCNWEAGYTIQFISGSLMDTKETQVLFPARSGSEVEIRIVFTAPNTPGRYNSYWQSFDPNGDPFGETFFTDIIVNTELLPTETPTPEIESTTATPDGDS